MAMVSARARVRVSGWVIIRDRFRGGASVRVKVAFWLEFRFRIRLGLWSVLVMGSPRVRPKG
jgi:hypothetical protein